jgi:hypothetical protein
VTEYLERRFASGELMGALTADIDADGRPIPSYD